MKKLIYSLFATAALLISCNKEKADPNPTYKGIAQSIGNGKVFSYMKFAGDKPTSVGITITKAGLENLPHDKPVSLAIELPTEGVGKSIFTHVYLDYSHSGHEPVSVYTYPHFDVHFMTQPNAERAAIGSYSAESAAKFDNLPPDGVIPPPYFKLPGGVPLMGAHWLNPATSPEVVPGGPKFTETLIMGSYDGKMTFIEPMITLELLQSHPIVSKTIPQPTKYQSAGYYPQKYSIQHEENGDCNISLEELVMKQ